MIGRAEHGHHDLAHAQLSADVELEGSGDDAHRELQRAVEAQQLIGDVEIERRFGADPLHCCARAVARNRAPVTIMRWRRLVSYSVRAVSPATRTRPGCWPRCPSARAGTRTTRTSSLGDR